MQEHAVTVGGRTYQLDQPFVVVATQNPIEQEGTYSLPEAQLDRFLLSIHIDYPTTTEELAIAERSPRMKIPSLSKVTNAQEFQTFIEVIDQTPVSSHVLQYAVNLTTASRPTSDAADDYVRNYVNWGVGPRGTQHLVTAAKAAAILDGRPSPEISDVQDMALPVMRHRIVPNYNALAEDIDASEIVKHLLQLNTSSVGAV